MKERHWDDVRKELGVTDLVIGEELKLQKFYDMKIQEKSEQIQEITDKAASEDKMGKNWMKLMKLGEKQNMNLKNILELLVFN